MVRTRKGIYVGDQEVQRRYIGNKLIFENFGNMDDKDKVSGIEIFTDKADDSVVHVEVDGVIEGLNNFDVVSSVGKRNLLKDSSERILLPRNRGDAGDNYNFTSLVYPTVEGQTYTMSADVEITDGEFFVIAVRANHTHSGNSIQQVPIVDGRITRTYTAYDTIGDNIVLLYAGRDGATRGNGVIFRNIKIEKGTTSTPWTPALEDIIEDTDHPLIDKINFSLSEPLRSAGDVKDRLFRDSDGLWKVERNVHTSGVEILSQETQDKLNNLRSFQNSNYVYTISNADISPTLHATFKSKGWYDDYKKTLLK